MDFDEEYPDYSIDKITRIIEAFNFGRIVGFQSKADFIRHTFPINIEASEVESRNIQAVAELIQLRLIMNETCPECYGWGCNICRGSGKNIQAIYK